MTGTEFIAAIARAARQAGLPWPLLRAIGLVYPLMRELARMSYLWREPHGLVSEQLHRVLGAIPHTPLDEALAATVAQMPAAAPRTRSVSAVRTATDGAEAR